MDKEKSDPKYLNNLVMHDIHQPVVFHGLIQRWTACGWTPQTLASVLGDKEVKIRIGMKEAKLWESTQWEASCLYETTTLVNFCDWMKQDKHSDKSLNKPQDRHDDNPLLKYDPQKYWCYIDYKYMAQLFDDHPDILQAVKWSDFGFNGRDGHQSTVWIGSQGATTPGHYDTYGCNLVAQIHGRKKWHLFPPSQSDALYQTRIPYEESSVFSPINIAKPDLDKYPRFSATTPYIVTLEPGDVLFVPRHWWHFVETLETSISVNTWIEMETDHRERYHEAITRALLSGIIPSSGNHGTSKWLNPTEELCDTTTNMQYLKRSLENLIQHQKQKDQTNTASQQTSFASALISDQLQNSSHVKFSENKEVAVDSTSAYPAKRRKCTADSQMSPNNSRLPDFVTVVPCLGPIYKTPQEECRASCLDDKYKSNSHCGIAKETDSHGVQHTSQSNTEKEVEKTIELKNQIKDCNIDKTESHHSSTASAKEDLSQGDRDQTDVEDVLELFLQSVSHPEVVNHIADLFAKKMKDKV